MLQVEGKNIV